jgi:hypothetical protein
MKNKSEGIKMDSDKNYVWYASYGSNINRDRFMCYIQGGSPEGSTRVETGCRDTTPPIAEAAFQIQYPLYFAKEASGWQSQGVGFLGLHPEQNDVTYGKIYLITSEQFLDVVKQENNGLACNIDLNMVKDKGSVIFRPKAWYGNVLYLGEKDNYPVFTFTAPWEMMDVAATKKYSITLKISLE